MIYSLDEMSGVGVEGWGWRGRGGGVGVEGCMTGLLLDVFISLSKTHHPCESLLASPSPPRFPRLPLSPHRVSPSALFYIMNHSGFTVSLLKGTGVLASAWDTNKTVNNQHYYLWQVIHSPGLLSVIHTVYFHFTETPWKM